MTGGRELHDKQKAIPTLVLAQFTAMKNGSLLIKSLNYLGAIHKWH